MTNAEAVKDRTLRIQKTLEAPLQLVWDAWTDPNHIAKWWGPEGMEATIYEHDFREGGKWKYALEMPDGKAFITEGQYSKIVVHQEIRTSADFKPMTEGVELQILFSHSNNKTQLTFNCIHPTVEYCKAQEKMGFFNGWGSTLKRLEEHLATF